MELGRGHPIFSIGLWIVFIRYRIEIVIIKNIFLWTRFVSSENSSGWNGFDFQIYREKNQAGIEWKLAEPIK